jgi:tRNA pseudouridine38-40 synthase
MERNIRLLLAYDGTDFHGWQKQPGLRTVQDLVEQAARRVIRHQVTINGSGRTDSGVHAAGQVANFLTTCDIPCDRIARAIGSRLPKDISIYHARGIALTFRASRDAVSKLYRYRIYNSRSRPVQAGLQRYTYHFWNPLDLDRLREAGRLFLGEHDFAGFATKGNVRESTVRSIYRVEVSTHLREVRIDVEGSGFLYNQVRNMVGTMIEIGRGHWEPRRVRQIIESRDRADAGPTAPARGLCLQWVRYHLRAIAKAEAEGRSDDRWVDEPDEPLERPQ